MGCSPMAENGRSSAEEKEETARRMKQLEQKLFVQQQLIKQAKLPVVVLLEGWGSAGKGRLLGRLLKNIDPRGYKVHTMQPPEGALRYPAFRRYWQTIPKEGEMAFYIGSWYGELFPVRRENRLTPRQRAARAAEICRFERQLTDNGYLVLKFFLDIDQKTQKKRIQKDLAQRDSAWRVEQDDRYQQAHYDRCREEFEAALALTDKEYAPWHVLDGREGKAAALTVYEALTAAIQRAAGEKERTALPPADVTGGFPLAPIPPLADQDPHAPEPSDYKGQLKALQKEIRALQDRLYRKQVPVVIMYEGWDAAGKGGNIKRLSAALDPRGYEVVPIASPEPSEKSRHYLWRFWNHLPKTGHIAIFDRSWYGRVMVERVEGFCTPRDQRRAYSEINEFEKQLTDWGAVVIKFFVNIDADTQLERFRARQEDPAKQWKITDEDWRNREKWPAYQQAIDEMLALTSTAYAPWRVLPSCNKHAARILALTAVRDELKKRL